MQLYLLLTERCNLNCSMCIRGRQTGCDMDFSMLQKLALQDCFSSHDLVLTGGEPTLYPQFLKILQFMCQHGNTVTVTSNGTSSSWICKELCREKNLHFQISLDGDESMHDQIRGSGTFRLAMETIHQLDKCRLSYSVASVASRKNVDALLRLSDLLASLPHMRNWKVSYEMPFGSAGFDDMMTIYEWNNFVDKLLVSAKFRLNVRKLFPFDLYDKKQNEARTGSRCLNCGSGQDKLYIYPDFTVYPCTCLTDFPLGNLQELSLQEIQDGIRIKAFCDYQIRDGSICSACPYLPFCNGGCIGMSYHYFGVLGMGDIRCPRYHNQE